jgi:hypothetical protein
MPVPDSHGPWLIRSCPVPIFPRFLSPPSLPPHLSRYPPFNHPASHPHRTTAQRSAAQPPSHTLPDQSLIPPFVSPGLQVSSRNPGTGTTLAYSYSYSYSHRIARISPRRLSFTRHGSCYRAAARITQPVTRTLSAHRLHSIYAVAPSTPTLIQSFATRYLRQSRQQPLHSP